MQSLERKGPHKSMHCEFCKPPGTVAPEGLASARHETRTKLHLTHEGADLQVFDTFDEPEIPVVESENCICQVEGQNPCPKCSPDKNRKPVKKKMCDCPSGSKPRSNVVMLDTSDQKKTKKKRDDLEFWWEKYDREHDAKARETWAAYLAQRKEEKRFIKRQEKEYQNEVEFIKPSWYQKLSCQQAMYLEYLSTAIRLDLDENIINRTLFVLGGIGLFPRPKKKVLHKCLRYCRYNAIRFLDQLCLLLQQEDPFNERFVKKKKTYSWNDRILMSCMCYLEFPNLLREIMQRMPPLSREQLLPPILEPKFPKPGKVKYGSPYEEPLWMEGLNWIEKQKLERINRARKHMDTKRVKIPALALVSRPSLIDARPPFLSQIVASQSFNRKGNLPKKETRNMRKKEKAIFNSNMDVTAIVGIEASEVSTTPKADTEEICVFLREQYSKSETVVKKEVEVEYGDEEFGEDQSAGVEYLRVGVTEPVISLKSLLLTVKDEDFIENEASEVEDEIPFMTPPKTESGVTIEEPCPCPKSSPAPPADHYDLAARELGIINEDICFFDPNEIKSVNDDEEFVKEGIHGADVEGQLRTVAMRLKNLSIAEGEGFEDAVEEKTVQKKKKKCKNGKKTKKKIITPEFNVVNGDHKINGKCEEYVYGENRIESEDTNEISALDQVREKERKDRINEKRKKRMKIKKKVSKKRNAKRDEREEEINSTVLSDLKMTKSPDGKKADENKSDYKRMTPGTKAKLEEEKMFRGDVNPLLKTILKDLKQEGFISASYENIEKHPDIKQLIKHLRGKIIMNQSKRRLNVESKEMWKWLEKSKICPVIPEMKISSKKYANATWSDKKWISNLARRKKEEYYFNIAKTRANEAKDFFRTLQQEYFGTDRFLEMYYDYMIAKYEDCILRGLF